MPMIDVYAAAGTFDRPHELARDLARAVMRLAGRLLLAHGRWLSRHRHVTDSRAPLRERTTSSTPSARQTGETTPAPSCAPPASAAAAGCRRRAIS